MTSKSTSGAIPALFKIVERRQGDGSMSGPAGGGLSYRHP